MEDREPHPSPWTTPVSPDVVRVREERRNPPRPTPGPGLPRQENDTRQDHRFSGLVFPLTLLSGKPSALLDQGRHFVPGPFPTFCTRADAFLLS